MHHRLTSALALCLTLSAAPAFAAPGSAGAERYVIQAKAERQAGKFDSAVASMEQALKVAPNDFDVLMAMGRLRDIRGEYEEALDFYQKCQKLRADDFGTEVMIAHAYLMLDKYDRARELCEKLENHPGRKEASSWYRSELYTTLSGALGFKSKREGIWAMLQYGLRVRGEIEKAVDLDPENPRAQYGLGRYFLEAPGPVGGDPKRGTTLLAKATKMDDEDFVIRGWYVRALFQTSNPEAKSEAERFAKDFSELPYARKSFADLIAKAK